MAFEYADLIIRYWWVSPAAVLTTGLITGLVCSYASRGHLLAIPNQRSSHSNRTPQCGGVSIVLVTTLASALLWAGGVPEHDLLIALTVGGIVIAFAGYKADTESISIGARLFCHLIVASWTVYVFGRGPMIPVGNDLIELGVVGELLAIVAIVWALNLFNFMDGIDGLAASEGIFVAFAGAALAFARGSPQSIFLVCIVIGGGCIGFLFWNWAPAKIFMGDIGSGFLGYAFAVLALATAIDRPVALYEWAILGGVFLVDATVTLLRRLLGGESIFKAHRSHAYQRLARRWGSHRLVTLAILTVNIGWLLPFAWLCGRYEDYSLAIMIIALAPLVCLSGLLYADTTERPVSKRDK